MKRLFFKQIPSLSVLCLVAAAFFPTANAQTQRWTRLVGTGDAAPGGGGAVFEEILGFAINDSGQIAFTARLSGTGVMNSNRFGLWFGSKSGFGLTLRQDENYIPFTNFGLVQGFDLNNAGEIAAIISLQGSVPIEQNDEAIFLLSGGARTLLLREGDMLTAATDFGDFENDSIRLRGDGRIAFKAQLIDPDPLEVGFFAGVPGAFDTAVRRGNVAPGLGNFTSVNGGESDLRDAIGLTTTVVKGSQGATEGLWAGVNGILSEIAIEGDATPFGGGNTFFGFDDATIEPGGRILFRASYHNGGMFGSGLFSHTIGGSVSTLFRVGDPAPGIPGTVLDSFTSSFQNGIGRIGFQGEISGPGVTPANDSVLFVQDGSGRYTPILRSGFAISPGGNPSRVVDWFRVNRIRGFAAKNQLLVRVHFTDGGAALYLVETGIPETKIRGQKRPKTSRRQFKIRGLAKDDEKISQVQYRIDRKPWRRAKGTDTWRKKVKIKKRRTRLSVRSFDLDGNVSKVRRIVVKRR